MSMNQEKKKEECDAPHAAPSPEQVPEKGMRRRQCPGSKSGYTEKRIRKMSAEW